MGIFEGLGPQMYMLKTLTESLYYIEWSKSYKKLFLYK